MLWLSKWTAASAITELESQFSHFHVTLGKLFNLSKPQFLLSLNKNDEDNNIDLILILFSKQTLPCYQHPNQEKASAQHCRPLPITDPSSPQVLDHIFFLVFELYISGNPQHTHFYIWLFSTQISASETHPSCHISNNYFILILLLMSNGVVSSLDYYQEKC